MISQAEERAMRAALIDPMLRIPVEEVRMSTTRLNLTSGAHTRRIPIPH